MAERSKAATRKGCYAVAKSYRRFESFPSPPPTRLDRRLLSLLKFRMSYSSMEIDGKRIIIDGTIPGIASLEQEWFSEDVEKPDMLIVALKGKSRPDIFTFWQRLPELEPKYAFRMGKGIRSRPFQ